MTYYHTVAIFAGSDDPVKVTSYTQVERDAYEAGLPSDARILYSGTSAGDMLRAFKAAQTSTPPTGVEVLVARHHRAMLYRAQTVCKPHEIHTRDQIKAIANLA